MSEYTGELAALLTAVFWTITALSFEKAGKKIGSLAVNLIRLGWAVMFLSLAGWFLRGLALPLDAGIHQWVWLSLSAMVGIVFGDYCLFKSYIYIGARVGTLIMSLAPLITAILGWLFLSETLTPLNILGMTLTLSGIVLVVLSRPVSENGEKKIRLNYSLPGLMLAFGGAVGQAVGLVIGKYGMQDYHPLAATQIRIIAGLTAFAVIITVGRRWNLIREGFKNRRAFAPLLSGSFFGPFLGITFSLVAIQRTKAGIAATIMSIVPVLIIIPAILFMKEKVKVREIIGAVISVLGVSLFFV